MVASPERNGRMLFECACREDGKLLEIVFRCLVTKTENEIIKNLIQMGLDKPINDFAMMPWDQKKMVQCDNQAMHQLNK